MSKPGSLEYDYSPLRSPCHRCGAMEEEACMPIKPGPHPTILGYHPERGQSPGHLEQQGYLPYVLVEPSNDPTVPDSRLTLYRKPRQQRVERDSLLPEGALSTTHARQERAGALGLQPREYDGELLLPCPEHPDSSAVDCLECEPVAQNPGD